MKYNRNEFMAVCIVVSIAKTFSEHQQLMKVICEEYASRILVILQSTMHLVSRRYEYREKCLFLDFEQA
jgi:hypothetical protein